MAGTNKNRIDVFSFFSGIGLLDLGFESAGYNIEFVSDVNKAFLSGYRYSRSVMNMAEPRFGYWISNIDSAFEIDMDQSIQNAILDSHRRNQIVLFIGGPPCPDFSVGGKNKGRHGDNGRLSQTYVDVIIHFKPDVFLFENVRGLWRTKRHREFYEELKGKLINNGYCITESLVNAIEFGVPQDRERIIMIGFRESVCEPSNTECQKNMIKNFPWDMHKKYRKNEIDMIAWPTRDEFSVCSAKEHLNGIIDELTVEYWFNKNRVTSHPNSKHSFIPRAGLKKFKTIDEGDVSRKSYKRLHRWRYSPTAAYGNNEVHLHPYLERRISVAEALAIQSLPAEFSLPEVMSLSDMFKSIGNGVPFLLAQSIAKSIISFLGDKYAYNR